MVIELGALAILQRNINAFINFLLFYNLILLSVTLSNFITINIVSASRVVNDKFGPISPSLMNIF